MIPVKIGDKEIQIMNPQQIIDELNNNLKEIVDKEERLANTRGEE